MTGKELLRAMGAIDDRFVEEAGPVYRRSFKGEKRRRYIRTFTSLAAAALVLTVGFHVYSRISAGPYQTPGDPSLQKEPSQTQKAAGAEDGSAQTAGFYADTAADEYWEAEKAPQVSGAEPENAQLLMDEMAGTTSEGAVAEPEQDLFFMEDAADTAAFGAVGDDASSMPATGSPEMDALADYDPGNAFQSSAAVEESGNAAQSSAAAEEPGNAALGSAAAEEPGNAALGSAAVESRVNAASTESPGGAVMSSKTAEDQAGGNAAPAYEAQENMQYSAWDTGSLQKERAEEDMEDSQERAEYNRKADRMGILCENISEAERLAGFTLTVPQTVSGLAQSRILALDEKGIEVIYSNGTGDHRIRISKMYPEADDGTKERYDRETPAADMTGSTSGMKEYAAGDRILYLMETDGMVTSVSWTDGTYLYEIEAGEQGITEEEALSLADQIA